MLLLNRKTNFYPKLKTIYVYPHTYVAKGLMNDGGLIVEGKSVRLGESWQNGPVVLTWDSITGGARNIVDAELAQNYLTTCDPRLNAEQSLEVAFQIADMIRSS